MIYPDKAARDAALGRAAEAGGPDEAELRRPLVTADGREVVVRVECTHAPLDSRTIALGIVRGWFYVMVIVVVLSLLLAAAGVGVDWRAP